MDLKYENFKDINLHDDFFDSLRADYKGFSSWFESKAVTGERAYVVRDGIKAIQGFLYLKVEDEEHPDILPPLPKVMRVKVGTLKINAHGTRLGQRFIKKMIDWAVNQCVEELYVTVFEKHENLIKLLERYGFVRWGTKTSSSGEEAVFIKKMGELTGDIEKDYPLIDASQRVFLLSILPKYHTKLFPDSILNTESPDIIKDVSSSNSIHKIYLCNMAGVESLKRNDILVIYRTADNGPAEYTAVATSIGVVEEVRSIYDFHSEDDFIAYASPYSVFTTQELKQLWKTKRYPKIVRFTYNVSLNKRPNRRTLIEEVGLDRGAYAGFMEISSSQLKEIAFLGKVNESIIVN
ncbi:N-acetyltransferase [Agrobacterium genomosp. 3]|uniref:GNAT family N-acetyltransferase n=1 Tax=Agrobacterium tomkonis TaxID=1183410 RepID=UPI001B6BC589|nr:N-acetyltransferase [Agrobacterium sp.]MCA1866467.1 N-acetyltransferase [Agrobacterium tomkonis]MCA1876819.1 N-acetyltransferase [Agrobacterium tumefaciens]MCA1892683.1 N-acetyltransferase [Agrobacterium tomkonis]